MLDIKNKIPEGVAKKLPGLARLLPGRIQLHWGLIMVEVSGKRSAKTAIIKQ